MRAWNIIVHAVTFPLLVASAKSHIDAIGARVSTLTSTALVAASTCPSETINYITQAKSQQCSSSALNSEPLVDRHEKETIAIASTTARGEQALGSVAKNASHSSNLAGQPSTEASSSSTETVSWSITTQQLQEIPVHSSIPTVAASSNSADASQDVDTDPLSDNANFLSFAEWKSQMLKKAGQSPEYVGSARARSDRPDSQRQPPGISNALDSLGDDNEIELDFSGFAVSEQGFDQQSGNAAVPGHGSNVKDDVAKDHVASSARKSQDAGTTCKERFNYASFDCAATVLKTNPECKGSTSVLVENKDSYMLNACSASNKFFIVELCNDILIDTLVLANFEFFSSTFRTFRVSISDRYPVKIDKWKELGVFEARNSRDIQAFPIENALIWARYLRIEFLTHYGNEHYCPVSLLRVHGKTMMDDYRNEVKATRGEEEQDEEVLESEITFKGGQSTDSASADAPTNETYSMPIPVTGKNSVTPVTSASSATDPRAAEQTFMLPHENRLTNSRKTTSSWLSYRSTLIEQYELSNFYCRTSQSSCHMKNTRVLSTAEEEKATFRMDMSNEHSSVLASSSIQNSPDSTVLQIDTTSSTSAGATSTSDLSLHDDKLKQNSAMGAKAPTKARMYHGPQTASKTSQHPPVASPTMQESFFKSVHKRLQLLESNSTLSLQYIEEQSRILREAFTKVEKRQLTKTMTFLEALNTTVLNEIREFRQQYDQIWQSTVLQLFAQREQSQYEVMALNERLGILADEVLFQKRIAILQFILMLLCLGLVIFARSGTAASTLDSFELGNATHNMALKSSTGLSRYLHLESRPTTPPRPSSRYGLLTRSFHHIRSPSNETTLNGDGHRGPGIEHQSPTPPSGRSRDEDSEAPTVDEGIRPESSPIPSAESPIPAKRHNASSSLASIFDALGEFNRSRSMPNIPSATGLNGTATAEVSVTHA